jgi:hypothetical protein
VQHQRIRLAGRLVGGAGRIEQIVEPGLAQDIVETTPRLAGRNADPVPARLPAETASRTA